MSHEVITIQCGHYSNFIGTHWWNIQESGFCYDSSSQEPQEVLHDCTFREGLTLTLLAPLLENYVGGEDPGYESLASDESSFHLQGEQTYTPRLLALDLPGSLKTLREGGTLYETAAKKANPAWEGKLDVHAVEPPPRNEFLEDLDRMDTEGVDEGEEVVPPPEVNRYDLNSRVEVWSDFLRLHLHPKSLLTLPGYFHNDPQGSFNTYPAGLQVWENRKFRRTLEDQLHFFVEECDHLQGFQLLTDWDNGFGAVASMVAEEIADEYPSKGLLAIPTTPSSIPLDKTSRFRPSLLNNALSLAGLLSSSSLVSPLSLLHNPWRTTPHVRPPLPHLSYQPDLAYHSSAIIASALDTATLLFRTEQSPCSLPALCDTLTAAGRKICSMGVCLPLPLPPGSTLQTELDRAPLPTSLHPLTPFTSHKDAPWSQAIALRGMPSAYPLCSPQDPRWSHSRHPSHVLAAHLAEHCPEAKSLFCVVQKPLALCPPCPVILPADCHTALKAPVCASLYCHSGTHQLLTTLLSETKATNVQRLPAFATSCLDQDSFLELLQTLGSAAECYQTGSPPECSSLDSD